MNMGVQILLDVDAVTYRVKPKGAALGSFEEIVPACMRSSQSVCPDT